VWGLVVSRIFLSHSSTDNPTAFALRDWLVAEGWNDLFLDLDPERGIVAGERWERALNEAASRCEAVLFLISKAWLASRWCLKELNLAHRLNKRMFGLLIEDIPLNELSPDFTSTWQLVRLATGRDHKMFRVTLPITGEEMHVTLSEQGLIHLKNGLKKAGLDASFFAWPPPGDRNRSPYRGLRPLEAEDVGIFFGRDAEIITALDTLRGLREVTPPRLLIILGASGAGKSSFLRAGLIPRLQRDDRNFLPLPVVRPERAVLTGDAGFVRSLEVALNAQGLMLTRADLKTKVVDGGNSVSSILETLAEKVTPLPINNQDETRPPTLVLSIDQGEELFLTEGAEEASRFLSLLKELLLSKFPDLICLFTIRSDAYEVLQTSPILEGIKQNTLSLSPLPKGAYVTVIEGPAGRFNASNRKLKIEPALTQALLSDIEAGGAKDALPLLAFTLERLFLEYGGDGDLRLDEYEKLGRVRGSIEAAVERAFVAANNDPTIPKDRAARLNLMRRGFIPWLAGIDPDTGAPRRRVARLSEIPSEARSLIRHLVEQRLLTTDTKAGGEVTIEPAHDALLRQWGLLEGWLEEDFAALATLEGVKRTARDWDANNRDPNWLVHRGRRLHDAERIDERLEFASSLDDSNREYIAACQAKEEAELRLENARNKRERRSRLRKIIGFPIALLLFLALQFYPESAIPLLERFVSDTLTGFAADKLPAQHPSLAVITIDDRTLQNEGYIVPVDRTILAELVKRLDEAGVNVIALDLPFIKSTESAKDQALLYAIHSAKAKVILAVSDDRRLNDYQRSFQRTFISSAGRQVAYTSLEVDIDGVIRQRPNAEVPLAPISLSEQIAAQSGVPTSSSARIAWLRRPANGGDQFLTLNALDILTSNNQEGPSGLLRGRLVLIGTTFDDGLRYSTPLLPPDGYGGSSRLPEVFVHAHIVAQLIDGRSVGTVLPQNVRYLVAGLALFAFLVGLSIKSTWLNLLVCGFAVIGFVQFQLMSYWQLRVLFPFSFALISWLLGQSAGRMFGSLAINYEVRASRILNSLLSFGGYGIIGLCLLLSLLMFVPALEEMSPVLPLGFLILALILAGLARHKLSGPQIFGILVVTAPLVFLTSESLLDFSNLEALKDHGFTISTILSVLLIVVGAVLIVRRQITSN
jgi:CHASE2 domain-containing sensor protein